MSYQEILYSVSDHVATITLNRPEKLNAWTAVMEKEVRSAMEQSESDSDVRVIVLTGAGRGFCSGADISLLSAVAQHGPIDRAAQQIIRSAPPQRNDIPADFQKKHTYLLAIEKPVIAAINGPAAGLGLVVALYCDLRFGSSAARFSTAFSRRGLVAEWGIAWQLPRIVGIPNALDLLFSARMVDSAEALRMGLVNQVFPQETFLDKVYEYARDLALNVSPRSMRVMKRQVYAATFQSLAQACDVAEDEMIASFQAEDFKEGVAHFVQKRAPAFTGR